MQFNNPQTELTYLDLKSRYKKVTLTKKDLAIEMSCSTSTIDLNISKGLGPNYIKMGTSKNASVRFNILDVAEYLTQTIKTA